MTDLALAQLPAAARCGTPILISADGAGSTKDWFTIATAVGNSR